MARVCRKLFTPRTVKSASNITSRRLSVARLAHKVEEPTKVHDYRTKVDGENVFQKAFDVAKVEQYMRKLLANEFPHRPWRDFYDSLSSRGDEVLRDAERVLTDTNKVAQTLIQINRDTERVLNSGIELGMCAHRSALSIALFQYERSLGLPEVANLRHTLSADEFFNVLLTGGPMIDEGVSVFHGTQTHRIQYRILLEHLGKERAMEVKKVIASEWTSRMHPLAGRMGGDDVVTLWDEIFDVSTPWYCSNPQSLSVRDLFNTPHEKVQAEGFLPCMDARSPEWLQHLCFTAPDDLPIGALKRCTGEELKTGRLQEVHHHVFLTGNEIECQHSYETYKQLGFVFDWEAENRASQ